MQIKKDSWHWKYIAKRWDRYPASLCSYFWKIVLNILAWIGGSVLLSIVAAFVLSIVSFPLWQFFLDFGEFNVAALFLASGLYTAALFLIPFKYRIYLYETGQLTRKIKPRRVRVPEREPGLFSQFIHAQHRKVCPLLEYEAYSNQTPRDGYIW